MIQSVFENITVRILKALASDREFFKQDEAKRKKALESAKLPEAFEAYMLKVSEKKFIKELVVASKAVPMLSRHTGASVVKANGLLDAFADYIVNQIGDLLDRLPMVFFAAGQDDRQKVLTKMKLPAAFNAGLSSMSYQDVYMEFYNFVKNYKPATPYIVVQAARDTSAEQKGEMRKFFKKEHKNAFPYFQVSKNLVGGMRVLVNGHVNDQSWIGKIERFTAAAINH